LATTVVAAVSHIPLGVPFDEVNVKALAAALRAADRKALSVGIIAVLLQGEGLALSLFITFRRWHNLNHVIVQEQSRTGASVAYDEAKDAAIW
jgi:hypothetical protein